LGDLTSLVVKEVKELIRDPKILIGVVLMPLLLFPVMGSAISISQESVERAIISASFAVYSEDSGPATEALLGYIYNNNTVVTIKAQSLEDALTQFMASDSSTLIHVPEGYSANVTSGLRGRLKLYANLKSLNIAEGQSSNVVGSLISIYNYYFSIEKIRNLLEEAGENAMPEAVRSPISVSYATILKGSVLEVAPSSIFSLVMSQSIMLPILVMIMVMFAIQMAATSIALEKEQKTLETLMTLPVGRMTILSGKLAGSIVIAVAGAVSYMVGFGFYMNAAFSFAPEMSSMSLGDVNLGIEPAGYVLLGATIFVTLVSALAMAISLATFTDNVRSAQSLTGVLIVPIILPALILMFSDIEMLPQGVQWILLIIPYTHSMIASKAAFLGDYWVVVRSIGYISVFTLAMLYLAARIFSTERIITARLTSFSLRGLLKRRT